MSEAWDDIRIAIRGDRFVVVDKPSGVLSVPGKGEQKQACVASWVRERFAAAGGPLIVHRLDMDTSGLMVLGLDAEAQRELSAQFEARTVEKRYTALVEGRVEREAGVLDAPMRLDVARRPYQVVDFNQGRTALTRYRVLAYEVDRTRLSLVPETGRTHQLRVHCAHAGRGGLGHAIVGDVLYGHAEPGQRLMLHASYLAFTDPGTGRRVEVESAAAF